MPGRDRTITVILSIPFVKKFQQLTNTCIYYNWGQNVCSNLVRLCGVCTTTKPKWRHYFMQVTVRWRHCCVTADWSPAFFRSFCSTWFVCLRSEENSAPDSAIITWLHLKKIPLLHISVQDRKTGSRRLMCVFRTMEKTVGRNTCLRLTFTEIQNTVLYAGVQITMNSLFITLNYWM